MEPQKQIQGYFAPFFTISVWGITLISTKVLLDTFTPVEIMFYRLILAVIVLIGISPLRLAWGLLNRHALRDEYKPMVALARKVFFYGLLFMLPVLPLFEFSLGVERLFVPPNLLNLLFLGLGASALSYVTWNYAVHRLRPVKTSVYIYMVPVVTIVVSALVLHRPSRWWLGLAWR
jgi:drug/metabolite transporter (DMT)-like permease